jgi:hypothetical protein
MGKRRVYFILDPHGVPTPPKTPFRMYDFVKNISISGFISINLANSLWAKDILLLKI